MSQNITVCVGNYAYYNEGALHDAWITLPVSDEELVRFLTENRLCDPEHEEYYISDYDGMPLGIQSKKLFNEYTSLEDLNLLAKQAEELADKDIEHIRLLIDTGACDPKSICELMNMFENMGELPEAHFWPDERQYNSLEERLGYALAYNEIESFDKRTLWRYFDKEAYARDLVDQSDIALGETGFVELDFTEISEDAYEEKDIIDKAKLVDDAFSSFPSEKVRATFKSALGYTLKNESPTQLEKAVCALVEDLTKENAEAVRLYADHTLSVPWDMVELGSVVLQADEIYYSSYSFAPYSSPDKKTQAGLLIMSNSDEFEWLPKEDLRQYFNYESYGEFMGQEYLLSNEGYVDAVGNNFVESNFDPNELRETIAKRWDEKHPESATQYCGKAKSRKEEASLEKDLIAAHEQQKLFTNTSHHKPMIRSHIRS